MTISIQNYRLALDVSPIPLVLVAPSGKIAVTNANFDALFEYATGDLIGQNIEVLVPQTLRDKHPKLRASYGTLPSKRKMGAGRDLTGVAKNGRLIPLELGLEPVVRDGETWALVAAIDITERLIDAQLMHLAMDASASAMITVDAHGAIIFANKTAAALFGYELDELLGHPVKMLVPHSIRSSHDGLLKNYLRAPTNRPMGREVLLFGAHQNGTEFPLEVALTPVETAKGSLTVATIIDLTERVSAAKALALKNEELEALNLELSHFAYSASHDLKAPLASVSGLLSICLEDLDAGDVAEVETTLRKVLQISNRSAEKVESIMKIAQASAQTSVLSEISLSKAIEDIWADLTGGIAATKLVQDYAHKEPFLSDDPTLKIILENLLSNALRYADPEKPDHIVNISSHSDADGTTITIKDNGIGISAENQPRVFEMFTKLDDRSDHGLGLALVKKHVDRLGGTISLSGALGTGAQFTVMLPNGGNTHG